MTKRRYAPWVKAGQERLETEGTRIIWAANQGTDVMWSFGVGRVRNQTEGVLFEPFGSRGMADDLWTFLQRHSPQEVS